MNSNNIAQLVKTHFTNCPLTGEISFGSHDIGWIEPQGRRGGGTLIFSHIRRLGPFFWVHNSEFQYFLGFSEK